MKIVVSTLLILLVIGFSYFLLKDFLMTRRRLRQEKRTKRSSRYTDDEQL